MTVKLIAPVGFSGTIQGAGVTYQLGSDRTIDANVGDVPALLANGWSIYQVALVRVSVRAPVAADLTSIVAAATPANGAATIAAQPPQPRKLQYRIVLGTAGTTDITAGTATVVGVDQDGNAITEVVQLATGASKTVKSAYAFAKVTSITIAGYAANGSGTGNTFGVGVSNDFGIPTMQGAGVPVNFSLVKSTKITSVLGSSVTAADDVAASATVDAVARTVAPTTAPSASGLIDYEFTCAYGAAA